MRSLAPLLYQTAMGIGGVTFPADPIENEPDYASALAAFEAAPPIRILFDNGAGGSTPGAPVAAFEQSFARLPAARDGRQGVVPGLTAAPCRGLRRGRGGVDVFNWSPKARPLTDFTGNTGTGWPVGHLAELSLDPESGRDGAVVRDRAARRRTWWWSARARFTPGSKPRRRTSISR